MAKSLRRVQGPAGLSGITREDLLSDRRLRELYSAAIAAGMAQESQDGRLKFWSTAEYALRRARNRDNPGGYFRTLICQPLFRTFENCDEDAARRRLKELDGHDQAIAEIASDDGDDDMELTPQQQWILKHVTLAGAAGCTAQQLVDLANSMRIESGQRVHVAQMNPLLAELVMFGRLKTKVGEGADRPAGHGAAIYVLKSCDFIGIGGQ